MKRKGLALAAYKGILTAKINPEANFLNYQEIALGEVTYEVRRVYSGERPAAELLLERLAQKSMPVPSFDETHTDIL